MDWEVGRAGTCAGETAWLRSKNPWLSPLVAKRVEYAVQASAVHQRHRNCAQRTTSKKRRTRPMDIELNGYYTMILATLVLLLGRFLVVKIKFLAEFNIPEPVAGGLLAGVI